MRPNTLAKAAERVISGEVLAMALSEFLDEFYLAATPDRQVAMLADEPSLTGDSRADGLFGAVAEYLAHQFELPRVPEWAFGRERYLDRAWHTSPFADDAFREYLTFASPAEFSSRNIFTEESPPRRARSVSAGTSTDRPIEA